MGYTLNNLGEFENKQIEDIFLRREITSGLTLIRYLVLLSSIANLLFGILDYLYLSWSKETLYLDFAVRTIILIFAIVIFISMNRGQTIRVICISTYGFALFVYGSHMYVASFFVPLNIMFETFSLVLLSTCLFLMPYRWVINLSFSLMFFGLYVVLIPFLSTEASLEDWAITTAFICWNTVVIAVLFYRINLHKRNHFAKELQLEELANTDHLTKINNRKACDDILEGTCNDSAAFSFILFDIDNFKQVNDTYGHSAGDEVIVSIIKYARNIIRKDDILARWGGEEFVIIMPNAKLNEATELATRVREQISLIKHIHIKQNITCSFGVTAFVKGDTTKSITRRADQLLYLAKEYGKNRVVAG